MSTAPGSVPVMLTRALFALIAAWWAILGVLMLTGTPTFGLEDRTSAVVLGAMMLGAALVLAAFAWLVLRGHRWIDYVAVAFILGNIALSFTDEVGIYDIGYATVCVVLLGTMLVSMRHRPILED